MARRVGITPGSGDYVAVVDTDADDATGATISAQVMVVVGDDGEVVDFAKKLDRQYAMQNEIVELLREILEELKEL